MCKGTCLFCQSKRASPALGLPALPKPFANVNKSAPPLSTTQAPLSVLFQLGGIACREQGRVSSCLTAVWLVRACPAVQLHARAAYSDGHHVSLTVEVHRRESAEGSSGWHGLWLLLLLLLLLLRWCILALMLHGVGKWSLQGGGC